jgi:inner membrane protein
MSPVTHFFVGWAVACAGRLERRERAMVAGAGIAPDVDGLGIVAELLTKDSERPLLWWSEYHHVLGHNLGLCLLCAGLGFTFARQRWKTAALIALSFHLHLLGDIVGARGPDGDQWPIPYLLPFSNAWHLAWEHQWALNAWPNVIITAVMIGVALYWSWRHGYSPLEIVSVRANEIFVETIRKRFPVERSETRKT